jgi:gas vesicle protein
MQHCINILGAALITVGVVSSAHGQSLGDVAKQTESRKPAAAKPAKVYTNGDLPKVDSSATPAAPAQPAATAPAASAQQPAPEQKPADGPKKDEAYWRGRANEIRDNLQRAKTFQEALQTRINSLSADFTSRDDPAQRSVVAADRQKALAELERVKKEIKDFEKQLSDLEDEARRAGVPPGWLR